MSCPFPTSHFGLAFSLDTCLVAHPGKALRSHEAGSLIRCMVSAPLLQGAWSKRAPTLLCPLPAPPPRAALHRPRLKCLQTFAHPQGVQHTSCSLLPPNAVAVDGCGQATSRLPIAPSFAGCSGACSRGAPLSKQHGLGLNPSTHGCNMSLLSVAPAAPAVPPLRRRRCPTLLQTAAKRQRSPMQLSQIVSAATMRTPSASKRC